MHTPCHAARKYTAACRSGKEKLLHDLVSLDILPQLVESTAARRRAEERQAAIEAMPKKRSSRLQVHSVCHPNGNMSDTCKGSCMPAVLRAIKDVGSVPDWMVLQNAAVDLRMLSSLCNCIVCSCVSAYL